MKLKVIYFDNEPAPKFTSISVVDSHTTLPADFQIEQDIVCFVRCYIIICFHSQLTTAPTTYSNIYAYVCLVCLSGFLMLLRMYDEQL